MNSPEIISLNIPNDSRLSAFEKQVKSKSDALANYFLAGYFLAGVVLASFYNTWAIALVVGSLSLLAYYSAKYFLPQSQLYQYVLGAVLGIFMAQYIFQMHGMFEMHFTAFIGSALLVTYHNWKLQIPLLAVVILHYALLGYLQFAGVWQAYFIQPEYLDLQTFIIHILLSGTIFFLCGLCAYRFNKYRSKYIDLGFQLGRLEEEQQQKKALIIMSDQLKASNLRLNETEKIARIGNWERSFANNMLIWSEEMYRIFDIERTGFNINYDAYLSFIHYDDRSYVSEIDRKCQIDKQPFSYECRVVTMKGTLKTIYVSGRVVLNDENKIIKTYGVVQDITGNKIIEEPVFKSESESVKPNEELLIKNFELLKTNSELDTIICSTSHNLRAPLTSVIGLVDLIEEETREPDTVKHARMIKGRIKLLDDYVVKLLNYSCNNRSDVAVEKISFHQAVWQSVNNFRNTPGAGKIDFQIQVNETHEFYSDTHRIKTIIDNLVDNAIKFYNHEHDNPFIHIVVNANVNQAEIIIEDNGIGISNEHREKIFEMFYRIEGLKNGTGLGLYLVKEIVEKLKGSVSLRSYPGKGSKFTITLKNKKNGKVNGAKLVAGNDN